MVFHSFSWQPSVFMQWKKAFYQLFKDPSISLLCCFVLISITFIDFSSNGFCSFFQFLVVFMMLRFCLWCQAEFSGWYSFWLKQFIYKLWGLGRRGICSRSSLAVFHSKKKSSSPNLYSNLHLLWIVLNLIEFSSIP